MATPVKKAATAAQSIADAAKREPTLLELAESYLKQELQFAVQRHERTNVAEALNAYVKLKDIATWEAGK